MKGFVISDLHLLTRWSSFEKNDEIIRAYLETSEVFIFNGDIFDFRWSIYGDIKSSIDKALNWLTQLIDDFPACRFIFIFGNHDSHKDFINIIGNFADSKENFEYHLAYVQIGSNLFLHGDIPIMIKDSSLLKRECFRIKKPENVFMSYLYYILISMRIHNLISFYFTPERSARIIHNAILKEKDTFKGLVKDVYFGHTHACFKEFIIDGICYHNSGALIKKQRFCILPVLC